MNVYNLIRFLFQRPRKYTTEDDRLTARRAQVARSVKAWRQRRSAARRSGGSVEDVSPSPENTTTTDETSSPKDNIMTFSVDETKSHDNGEEAIPNDRASVARSSTFSSDTSLIAAPAWNVHRKLPELLMNNASSFLDSLLPDFLVCSAGVIACIVSTDLVCIIAIHK